MPFQTAGELPVVLRCVTTRCEDVAGALFTAGAAGGWLGAGMGATAVAPIPAGVAGSIGGGSHASGI